MLQTFCSVNNANMLNGNCFGRVEATQILQGDVANTSRGDAANILKGEIFAGWMLQTICRLNTANFLKEEGKVKATNI